MLAVHALGDALLLEPAFEIVRVTCSLGDENLAANVDQADDEGVFRPLSSV